MWVHVLVAANLMALGVSPALAQLAEGTSAAPLSGGAVRVLMDFARPITLSRPASTVIIGNAAVAQASLSDNRTLIITGKMPGFTNLIVLDNAGEEVTNIVLDVVAGGRRLVVVHQGTSRTTFKCDGRCDPILSVGDNKEYFDATAAQIGTRGSLSDVPGATQ